MIDIEKFICSLLADHPVGVTVREDIHKALKDQGLEYKGGKIVPIEFLEKHKNDTLTAYVVTRCEEHSDYVEKVFFDEEKAQKYCDQFKGNENEYARHITKVKVTL